MQKTETKSTVLLQHHLKALKLPTMQRECEKTAARCATENVDHLAFLLQLCELELLDRERRAAERRLKAAKFPTHKTLDSFNFAAQPSLNKVLLTELLRGEYNDKRENVALFRRCVGAEIPTQKELGYDFAVGKLSGAGVQAGDDSDGDSNCRPMGVQALSSAVSHD